MLARSLSGLGTLTPRGRAAAKVSHAAKGYETDPRRLVSEVGPSETGHCVSGAGGPSYNKTITAPRRLRVAEELMKLVNGTIALSRLCCPWRIHGVVTVKNSVAARAVLVTPAHDEASVHNYPEPNKTKL